MNRLEPIRHKFIKERSIIFSTEMVKAILDNKKTQTRRVIKPQPHMLHGVLRWSRGEYDINWKHLNKSLIGSICPYGRAGDRLWVRETCDYIFGSEGDYILYKANDDDLKHFRELRKAGIKVTWKPSIHMPRWASRITLEITEVRAERLQEITNSDIKKEGFYPFPSWPEQMIDVYWDKLYAKRGYHWESNPWVWVISFKRVMYDDKI